MFWLRRKIRVTLIDHASGRVLTVKELRPSELPDSFDLPTNLELGGEMWQVVSADRPSRAQFESAKLLTLRLQRIEMLDPKNILYSLPTICDRLPGLDGVPPTPADRIMHEDDWRQVELVSTCNRSAVDRQMEAIRTIFDRHSVGCGFKELHIRNEPDPPICTEINIAHLLAHADPGGISRRVSFEGAAAAIADGFCFEAAGLEFYGHAPADRVQVLGIVHLPHEPVAEEAIDRLVDIASRFELELVHWCRCRRAVATHDAIRELLG